MLFTSMYVPYHTDICMFVCKLLIYYIDIYIVYIYIINQYLTYLLVKSTVMHSSLVEIGQLNSSVDCLIFNIVSICCSLSALCNVRCLLLVADVRDASESGAEQPGDRVHHLLQPHHESPQRPQRQCPRLTQL